MTELSLGRIFRPKAWLILGLSGFFAVGWVSASGQTLAAEPSGAAVMSHHAPASSARSAPQDPSSAWKQLTPIQRQALAPLGAQWRALTPQQQNKWLTISKNFNQLPVADQITMHSRMADWVDLSPQQRNLARLNFNQLQSLPKEDKKAKWEAYQALTAEEKRLLVAGTASPAKSAAPTAKPVEPHRQVQTPVRAAAGSASQPSTIDRKTLLPLQPTLATPSPNQPSPTEMPEGLKPASETSPS
ncbi:DUF3106 domain-containing protein [Limnohabitans sp. Rim8]|uniref:DUF3106 domain-containing protein n=1 Tax=Limnohabitans sp. Rim8 TaxID=1100718 RepID=UPI0025F06EE0|nr:DUF3106 domain-containing protein [Limnohabitans sp. Rim8]